MFNLQVNKFNIAIVAVNNLNTNLLNFLALEANHALKAKLGKFWIRQVTFKEFNHWSIQNLTHFKSH